MLGAIHSASETVSAFAPTFGIVVFAVAAIWGGGHVFAEGDARADSDKACYRIAGCLIALSAPVMLCLWLAKLGYLHA